MLSAGDVMTVTGRPSIRFGSVVHPIRSGKRAFPTAAAPKALG
jgi:hypothetical protein